MSGRKDDQEKIIPQGRKDDSGKVPLQLIPGAALLEIGLVLRHGASKYGASNWRAGLAYTRLIGAILRHVVAFNEGENLDPETGISHIAHAACEAMFLLQFIKDERVDLDDRFSATLKKIKEAGEK